jgi:UDP-MurNAc hydroxylase
MTTPEEWTGVDALYISHVHKDHADPETLKHFRRNIPIFTLKDGKNYAANALTRMGFTRVFALEDQESVEVGPFEMTMFGPFCKHPHHDCEVGNVVDSAMRLAHKSYSVLNCNDNTPSVEAAEAYRKLYGSPTVAQLNYNSAGPYPACFDNLTYEQKRAEHFRLIEVHLSHMVAVAQALQPEYVMPFAGAYKLQDESLNPVLGTTTPQHAAARAQLAGFQTLLLGEGHFAQFE